MSLERRTSAREGLLACRPDADASKEQLLRDLMHAAVLGLAYIVTARLSLNLALVHGQVTPIWPPTGIALVGILVCGRRMWPAIALAAFAVNLPIGPSPLWVAGIAAGNTLAPVVAAELLTRAHLHLELDRLRDAAAIVVLGALIGMTISATVGTSVLVLSGAVPPSSLGATWAVWWTGDAMGVLLVAPFLLSFLPRHGLEALGRSGRLELAALLVAVAAATYVLFQNPYRLEYLVLPLIMYAAWRFRMRGATPAALMASLVAIWAAVNGDGAFAHQSLFEKMITLQGFNVSVSLASFVFVALVEARQQQRELTLRYESAALAIGAKTSAISQAARELNAPLAVLSSYVQIIGDAELGPVPPTWEAALNAMADTARQLDRIVGDLQEAARIEANPVSSRRDRVDLRDVVKDAVERARMPAGLTGAQVVASLGPDPVPVEADPLQLGRILDVLVSNGLTFNAHQPRLDLTAVTEKKKAIVRVADNGIGFAEDEKDRAFEPFYRGTDPAFEEVRGPGLGLYIGRKLAEANGGRLTIERTRPGQGTHFALVLPLATTDHSENGGLPTVPG